MRASGSGPPLIRGIGNVFAACAGVVWTLFMKFKLGAPVPFILVGVALVLFFGFCAFFNFRTTIRDYRAAVENENRKAEQDASNRLNKGS